MKGRTGGGAFWPALALLLGACGGPQSMLRSTSPGAAEVERLWWVSLVSTGVLALVVVGALLWAVVRSGRAGAPREGGDQARREERFILLAGGAVPAVFLVGFLAFSVGTGRSVTAPPSDPEFTIEVTGHMFWWDVHYPDHGITTANEIHVPVGRPVRVVVTSADVIHSFWVPQLGPGKIDMIPGRSSATWLLAMEPGAYRGQCTEFCGRQHALMSLEVVALPDPEFEAWVATRTAPHPPLEGDALAGEAVFVESGCASCHRVEGLDSPLVGTPGPDLTDVAARRTLGALTVPNTVENLTAWIVDPHRVKPGVRMPATTLQGPELASLLAYLGSLR